MQAYHAPVLTGMGRAAVIWGHVILRMSGPFTTVARMSHAPVVILHRPCIAPSRFTCTPRAHSHHPLLGVPESLGILVCHLARPIRVRLDLGVEAAPGDHADDFPDQPAGISVLADIEMNLHIELGISIFG